MADETLASRRLPVTTTPESQPYLVSPGQQQEPLEQGLIRKMMSYFGHDTSSLYNPAAIAVTPETAPIFAKAMKEAVSQGEHGYPLLDAAKAFLQTRYPRFASQVPIKTIQFPTPSVLGQFGERSNTIFVDPSHPLSNLHQNIKTLAHEMVHARQFNQRGLGMLDETIKGVPYSERVIEQQANQGMETARSSFNKLLNFLDEIGITPHDILTGGKKK